jgi:hypothetical protein
VWHMSRAYMESMAQSGEQIPPAVKAWIDNVLVPALVEQWVNTPNSSPSDYGPTTITGPPMPLTAAAGV